MTRIIRGGADWTYDDLYWMYDEIEKVANEMGGFDIYTNQVEVITAEQMLDCYTTIGMPVFYDHWSFGKHFLRDKDRYFKNWMGLAYEIVINSNPCRVYIMEQNTQMMQALVMAHAGIGHNHFFKTNYMFQQRTNASSIIDYLVFAKKYIAKCEEKYGVSAVERVIDACHALNHHGVFKYPRKEPLSLHQEMQRKLAQLVQKEADFNLLWTTLPAQNKEPTTQKQIRKEKLNLPEENILYFIETYSPKMARWKREILRIARNIQEYFYPQAQDKVMNEGCATWTHYEIMHRLHDKGIMDNGAMMEFLESHSGVVTQLPFNHPAFHGFNPYALGWHMMKDIARICHEPMDEDKHWFPLIAGCNDSFNVLKDAWANYRDESFIRQYLSPKMIRHFKMFALDNEIDAPVHVVQAIHDERGYQHIRELMADMHDIGHLVPEINITDVDLEGDRKLKLTYVAEGNRHLNKSDAKATLKHLANLWGYEVRLNIESEHGVVLDDMNAWPDEQPTTSDDDLFDAVMPY